MRRMRQRLAAFIAALILGAPLRAQVSPATSLSYRDLIALYSIGDTSGAWSALTAWPRDRINREISTLLATPHGERQIEAAVMLHSDLGFYAGEIGDRVTAFGQFEYAERLMRSLRTPESSDFRRYWYVAASALFLQLSELAQARRYAEAGRRAFPRHASLWILAGAIDEAQATLPSRWPRSSLRAAESAYRKAIPFDEPAAEAHLRLGRVLHLLNRATEAREELSRALAADPDPRVQYLAHLFGGRIAHDAGEYAEAEREFEAARIVDPDAQTPYIALSDVAEHRGRHSEARAYAERLGRLPRHEDRWWDYNLGAAGQFEPALVWLRRAVRQ